MMKTDPSIVSIPQNHQGNQHKPSPLSVTLATITGLENGHPLVNWPENPNQSPIKALSQIKIEAQHLDKPCTLAFVDGDQSQAVIMGLLYNPSQQATSHPTQNGEEALVIQSDESITLQAGPAKIQLYADGRINLQGAHINSQAYGPNKIKGTSIKIN